MLILTANQMRLADTHTISKLDMDSWELMERAATACFENLRTSVPYNETICLVCGPGNNGGDGLAIARLLITHRFHVECYLVNPENRLSRDCEINFKRLLELSPDSVKILDGNSTLPDFSKCRVVVDALFGTGITRTVSGIFGQVIDALNASRATIFSIDLPSGIYSDKTSLEINNHIVKSHTTLTFQYMKRALLLPENAPFTGKVEVLDVGIEAPGQVSETVKQFMVDEQLIAEIYRPRQAYGHKGTFGHTLLCCGGEGKMGAAILAARSYLKSGGGLLTMLIPAKGEHIMQTAVPEAMCITYEDAEMPQVDLSKYKAIGAGPGMGTGETTKKLIYNFLQQHPSNLVLDADALNILPANGKLPDSLPANTLLTPHPGEFKRLAGEWENDFDKLDKQLQMAMDLKLYLILKGHHTSMACPDGTIYFNNTGNPGMAKGGSGDVLTGLLSGLLAAGYSHKEAALLGVYLHGLAGDLAAAALSQEAMNAGDLINFLPEAWKKIAAFAG